MGLAVPARPPLRGLLGLNDVSLGAGCGLVARIVIRRIPQRQINWALCPTFALRDSSALTLARADAAGP